MELNEIPHKIAYRKVRYARLEFVTGKLHLVLPYGADPDAVYRRHKRWVEKKLDFIKECRKVGAPRGFTRRAERDFMEFVNTCSINIAKELRVTVRKVVFRHMRTKWASCNSKGNITINTLMKNMPGELIEYVVYHEVAHLKQMGHNEKFWGIIAYRFPHYKELEKELSVYWFCLNS